jgi:hypothetical protein
MAGFFSQFTPDQLRAGYARNLVGLRGMRDKAVGTGRKVNGYTAAELSERVANFERLSRSSDAEIRAHVARTSVKA